MDSHSSLPPFLSMNQVISFNYWGIWSQITSGYYNLMVSCFCFCPNQFIIRFLLAYYSMGYGNTPNKQLNKKIINKRPAHQLSVDNLNRASKSNSQVLQQFYVLARLQRLDGYEHIHIKWGKLPLFKYFSFHRLYLILHIGKDKKCHSIS